MHKQEIDNLVKQIRCTALGKSISDDLICKSPELEELQSAMNYLFNCIGEMQSFVGNIAVGNLEVKSLNRNNFMSGGLKELHANLRHLAWQASRVAEGDYSQRVSYLGDFSDSFNKMIKQLSEREYRLIEQSKMNAKFTNLFKQVMNGLTECIIVMSKDDDEIIYINESAKLALYENGKIKEDRKKVLRHMKNNNIGNEEYYDFFCEPTGRFFEIKSYLVQWNEKMAYINYLNDVTDDREYKEELETKAYTDELTGLMNRHFCFEKMKELICAKVPFVFCLMDVDGLKYANDNFGHNEGDYYLQSLADEMKNYFNENTCRLGGDEFVIISLEENEKTIVDKVKKINDNLEKYNKEYPMSISYGVEVVTNDNRLTMREIIDKADVKMYKMKDHKKKMKLSK